LITTRTASGCQPAYPTANTLPREAPPIRCGERRRGALWVGLCSSQEGYDDGNAPRVGQSG
jgi:hypothetical protein